MGMGVVTKTLKLGKDAAGGDPPAAADDSDEAQLELTLAAESDEQRDDWVRVLQDFRNEMKKKTRSMRDARRFNSKDIKMLLAGRQERLSIKSGRFGSAKSNKSPTVSLSMGTMSQDLSSLLGDLSSPPRSPRVARKRDLGL